MSHYTAAVAHLGEAEYRMATGGRPDEAAAYAAMAQARAALALLEALTADDSANATENTYKPRKNHKVTREHLDAVAEVYRSAKKDGEPPTRAVADHYGTSHSTAAKWVGRARKAGLLPPTTAGAS